jgi:hypothetical protein
MPLSSHRMSTSALIVTSCRPSPDVPVFVTLRVKEARRPPFAVDHSLPV